MNPLRKIAIGRWAFWRRLAFIPGFLLCFALLNAAPAPPEHPNIVLIFCDDLGYNDIGPYKSANPTPNLDRLAREGIRFTHFYVAQPVCSASRAALMTGCYPNRIGILGALGPNATNGLHANELTVGELLKSRGYATAIFGKWHLGHHPEFLPTRHGFDQYYGLPYSNDMWPRHPSSKFPDLPLIEGEKSIELNPDQRKLTREYTERAVRFIRENRRRPFFLYLAHSMPHVPLHVSERFDRHTGRGLYADVVAEIDWSVGEVLRTLARENLDRSTLVVFTSDNGPWLSYGNHAGSAIDFREGKATVFEGGVRVPFLARWPGQIPAGSVCREPAITIDLFPTFARLSGATMPRDRIIDGKDIWPLLAGDPHATSPHEAIFFYWGKELHAVRSGRWKLHFEHDYPSPEAPGADGKPAKMGTKKIGLELFDLVEDPAETTPLTEKAVTNRLAKLAAECRLDLGDALRRKRGKNVRPAGTVSLANAPLAERRPPPDLSPLFRVPKLYTNASTKYKSPLEFADGRRVTSKAEWPKRRQEMLDYWTKTLGPWPPLLERPAIEVAKSEVRGTITQHWVRVEIASRQFVQGILLRPEGDGPFRAVVVPYYEPETSVGQSKQTNRDFGYQLAKRGFITLSIGSPGGDARKRFNDSTIQRFNDSTPLQPLSFLAYVAANCHTALAQMPDVDAKRIGIVGHSYGSKWAMFASCLYDKFACAAWCDGGIVFDEKRPNVNYWEPWYLGWEPDRQRKPGVVSADNPRTGAYKVLMETGHDLHELHALMAPRPFFVSG
ncbi:MAG: sulfatase-like hydrolase/transferase, partial [Verrucomicrobia subdivision 3 bacterium]|nr:sulfatase-like hydrolase/transferase [Limisphaerales bacterium]